MNGIACAFQGRIGSEPELRYTQAGQPLLSFSVAVNDAKAADGADTEWVRVAFWGEPAERLYHAGTLTKGVECYVEGRLKLNTWQAPDGQQRAGLNVSAWAVQPFGQIGRRPKGPAPLLEDDRSQRAAAATPAGARSGRQHEADVGGMPF